LPVARQQAKELLLVLTGAMERGLPVLRDYLDQIGFVQLYKFIVTPALYRTNPNALSWASLAQAADLESYVTGDNSALALAACLMLKISVPRDALTSFEQRIAERLLDANLLVLSDGNLAMGRYQLISAHDMPLLIDSRINYPGTSAPEVYLGTDSLLLTSYVDTCGIAPTDRVIDLGTGSGVIGLFLARYSDQVTMTDVSPQALELTHVNRLLNRMTGGVAIREEQYEETLSRDEKYHIVVFNPPFMPVPDGLDAPVFARGIGPDGLGYCRMLLEKLDHILLPNGTAYIVVGLLGTADGPFFTEQLRRHADRHGRPIDVYIDSPDQLIAGAPRFNALGVFLHRLNPAVTREECQRRMEALQMHTLGATHAYPSVLVIRGVRDSRPSVRVFHRRASAPLRPSRSSPAERGSSANGTT
jgi:methylase of polypeptide subunit release factors